MAFSCPFFGVGSLKTILYRWRLKLHTLTDDRGSLTVIEKLQWPIKRVYYLHSLTSNATRGGHAHKALHRLIIAAKGSFTVNMRDRSWSVHTLDKPNCALEVPPLVWLELSDFSPDAVCLVIASEEHDEHDCIRDFEEFLRFRRANL